MTNSQKDKQPTVKSPQFFKESLNKTSQMPESEVKPTSRELGKRRILLSRLKRKLFKHVWVVRVLIVLGFFLLVYLLIVSSDRIIRQTSIPYYYNMLSNFVFTPKGVVREINGRTNILVLGKGGEGHDAPDLTDTILFISLNRDEKRITMISLPRDIWFPALRTKLNSVYYWGNKKEDGGGIILAKSSVEEILGQHVHYAVVLDFSAFKKIIDVLGGVEVEVETSFIDEKYPITGKENDLCDGDSDYKCRYETLRFVQGGQMMDGETALKFARSRNAEGDEGTDFARQKRQQKIIKAIEERILNREILLSPTKLFQLKNAFLSNIETDIKEDETSVIARYFLNSRNNLASHVLPEELLDNPPKLSKYDNLYVFVPKKEDPSASSGLSWSEVHEWVVCVYNNKECL